jgi:predicted aspartyl protease
MLVLVSAFALDPAHAQTCKLVRIASLDMTVADGGILVPVSIEGNTRLMIVDTGSPLSAVQPAAAASLKLITHRLYEGQIFASNGLAFTDMAVVHSLGIGDLKAADVRFLVWPYQIINDPRIAGTLGADFLRHYDIELDFAAKKLNLFSQDHCPGKVVYWTTGPVAVVPMHVVQSGHIIVPVTLDGHNLDAVFDTGAFGTILTLEAAENDFGLTPNTPELALVPHSGKNGAPFYQHVFKSLVLDGIAINNPTVYVREDLMKYGMDQHVGTGSRLGSNDEESGMTDLTLGMRELQHLHIYIAYKEQRLYITAASPPPGAASADPAAGTGTARQPH